MANPRSIATVAIATLGTAGAIAAAVWVFRTPPDTAAGPRLASLTAAYNDVTTKRAKSLAFQAGEVGQPLYARDSVKTGEEARAVVTYDAGGLLSVDPSSLVVITAPDAGGVQTLIIESGSLSGELVGRVGGPRTLALKDGSGRDLATLVPEVAAGEALKYRIRVLEGDRTEVAILKGAAEVSQGGKKVRIGSGQVVELSRDAISALEQLPDFPASERPGVDAQVDLAGGPERAVTLAWGVGARAARYHLQVGRQVGSGFAFDSIVLDRVQAERTAAFEPKEIGTYLWRVSSVDAKGREGEYGFARRFTVLSLPGGEPVAAPEPAALPLPTLAAVKLAAKVTGDLTRTAADGKSGPAKGAITLVNGDVLAAGSFSTVALGKNELFLAPGAQLTVRGGKAGTEKAPWLELGQDEGVVVASLTGGAIAGATIEAGPARIEAAAARLRSERRDASTRVICEKGEATVSGAGKSVPLPAGHAVEVTAAGPGEVVKLPAPPPLVDPPEGKEYDAVDATPKVDFAWGASAGAARYRFVIARSRSLADVVVEETTTAQAFSTNTLRPGRYYWAVQAIDGNDFQGPPPAPRYFSLVKDDKPPSIQIVSPAAGTTTAEDRVEIVGKTAPGARVKVNLKDVEVGADGGFRASVPLLPGPNSVNVEAIAPSGKSAIEYVRVRRE